MRKVLAGTLSNTAVLGSDGEELGTIYNVTMDHQTGALEYVLVEPAKPEISGFETTENGHLCVPAKCIESLSDYLVVRRPKSRDH
ncbi:PRC-barrel domain-containing protein [Halorientalis brevis]|uniref:PRC-barrel domain-containing protein n=1 Tax=Halorientalis brevis TaxID=1126241 RepID=A0ABD6CEW5_9EURY|nr:PRC-barrel domain-containing protein [Halorientalis brevis]